MKALDVGLAVAVIVEKHVQLFVPYYFRRDFNPFWVGEALEPQDLFEHLPLAYGKNGTVRLLAFACGVAGPDARGEGVEGDEVVGKLRPLDGAGADLPDGRRHERFVGVRRINRPELRRTHFLVHGGELDDLPSPPHDLPPGLRECDRGRREREGFGLHLTDQEVFLLGQLGPVIIALVVELPIPGDENQDVVADALDRGPAFLREHPGRPVPGRL